MIWSQEKEKEVGAAPDCFLMNYCNSLLWLLIVFRCQWRHGGPWFHSDPIERRHQLTNGKLLQRWKNQNRYSVILVYFSTSSVYCSGLDLNSPWVQTSSWFGRQARRTVGRRRRGRPVRRPRPRPMWSFTGPNARRQGRSSGGKGLRGIWSLLDCSRKRCCTFRRKSGRSCNLKWPSVLVQEETTNESRTIHFLKLHVPWDVMVFYAEELSLRAPLQVSLFKMCHYRPVQG